jgi:hypothetical protein
VAGKYNPSPIKEWRFIMKGNKRLLLIGLPLAVVLPLLVASYFIGPASVWLWAGVGLGMVIQHLVSRREGGRREKVG